MSLTKKQRGDLLKMRIRAYKISYQSDDLLVINYMNAVVEFADKARREDSLYFAKLAKRNFEVGNKRILEIGDNND